MSVGEIVKIGGYSRAKAPVQVSISDGTVSYPYGHPLYFTSKQPDGLLLLDLAKREYLEFKVYADRDFQISLFNQEAGSRYKLFIVRSISTQITVNFQDGGNAPIVIEGSSTESLYVLSVEVAKVGGSVVSKVIDNIYDADVSINNTWSSQKISDKLAEETTARQSGDAQTLSDAKSYTDDAVFDASKDQSITLTGDLTINYTASDKKWYIPNTITYAQLKEFFEQKLPRNVNNPPDFIFIKFQSGTYAFSGEIYIKHMSYGLYITAESVSTGQTKNVTFELAGQHGFRLYHNISLSFTGIYFKRGTNGRALFYVYATNAIRFYNCTINSNNVSYGAVVSFHGMGASLLSFFNNYFDGNKVIFMTSGETINFDGHNKSITQNTSYIFKIENTTVKGDLSGFNSSLGLMHTNGHCIVGAE